jgi:hypothetical protein
MGWMNGVVTPPKPVPPLGERIREVRQGLARLQATLRDQCPGDHHYEQHRDRLPPWCDACGFTDIGLHRREYGTGKGTGQANADDGEEE